jgi:hypothetical protein
MRRNLQFEFGSIGSPEIYVLYGMAFRAVVFYVELFFRQTFSVKMFEVITTLKLGQLRFPHPSLSG